MTCFVDNGVGEWNAAQIIICVGLGELIRLVGKLNKLN